MREYKCGYCGWVGTEDFFWYYQGQNYCSLHLENKAVA